MSVTTAKLRQWATIDPGLPARVCRVMSLFALQGITIVLAYRLLGPDLRSTDLPLGLQLDVLHGWLHLAVGVFAALMGFVKPRLARAYLQLFGISYLILAALGTFTSYHLGMELELPENTLHWILGAMGVVVGFHPATRPDFVPTER